MIDTLYRPVNYLLEPVDRQCNVDFLRRGIARRAGRFIMRAEPDASVFGFEVEAAIDVEHQWQVRRHAVRHDQLRHAAAIGPNAKRARACQLGDRIGPCPRGIDQRLAPHPAPVGQLQVPAPGAALCRYQRGAAPQFGPGMARLRQIVLMQTGNIDIAGTRFTRTAGPFGAQAGNLGNKPFAIDHIHLDIDGTERLGKSHDLMLLPGPANGQPTPWMQHSQGMQFRPCRRSQRLDAGTAVAFHPEGG